MNKQALLFLFDLDGTLVQSYYSDDHSYFRAFTRMMDLEEMPKLDHKDPHLTDSYYFNALVKHLRGSHPSKEDIAEMQSIFEEELHANFERAPQQYHEIPGAKQLLSTLKDSPHLTGVASGGWKKMIEFKLQKIDALHLPDGVIGCDDHYDKAGFTDALRQQLDASKARKPIYFGDSLYDYNRMQHLNIPFVGVDFKQSGLFDELDIPVVEDFTKETPFWDAVGHYYRPL